MPAAVASRYARALAEVVLDSKSGTDPARVVAEIRAFGQTLASSNELKLVLESPSVAKARKRAVIGKLAAILALSKPVRNFLMVLIDHRRLGAMAEIASALEKIFDDRMGILKVELTAAQPLNEAQQKALSDGIGAASGKKVGLHVAIDPSLIGGVVARIGSTVYDGSVRGKLETLGRRLAAE
jgi:F-type H+-transporting ATPase subunit delta